MGIKPTSSYENIWIYYIIIVNLHVSVIFVALFREVFLQRIYYKDIQANTKYEVLHMCSTIYFKIYKVRIKLFVLKWHGYEAFMCCVCCTTIQVRWWCCVCIQHSKCTLYPRKLNTDTFIYILYILTHIWITYLKLNILYLYIDFVVFAIYSISFVKHHPVDGHKSDRNMYEVGNDY